MEPKLYQLLVDLVKAYRRGENIDFEISHLEDVLQKIKQETPVANSPTAAKLLEYIQGRKTPVTTADVGKYFGLSRSTVANHFLGLTNAGLLAKKRKGNTTYYSATGASMPVAISDEPIVVKPSRPTPIEREQPKVIWPTNPFKTSYPHVRGYDD